MICKGARKNSARQFMQHFCRPLLVIYICRKSLRRPCRTACVGDVDFPPDGTLPEHVSGQCLSAADSSTLQTHAHGQTGTVAPTDQRILFDFLGASLVTPMYPMYPKCPTHPMTHTFPQAGCYIFSVCSIYFSSHSFKGPPHSTNRRICRTKRNSSLQAVLLLQ